MSNRYADAFTRFVDNVDIAAGPDSCWLWRGRLNEKGYGIFRVGNKRVRAHRWLIERTIGCELEGDELITHDCDTAACVNPRHLAIGDQESNMRERAERGRHWCTQKTQCPEGHSYTPENTYVDPRGYRNCRACARERHRRRRSTPAL